MNFAVDIHTFVQVALLLTLAGIVASIWIGIRSLVTAHKVKFFRLRQERTLHGWKALLNSVILSFLALFLFFGAEPIAYRYFPPTATLTITPTATTSPTITLRPTITLTATITQTPSESYTPTSTNTPFIPNDVVLRFSSEVTPDANAVFSELIFASRVDKEYRPIDPGSLFNNPIREMYAIFSYDKMLSGVQWTALWLRNGNLVYFETYPWDGSTGGYAYSVWSPTNPQDIQAGTYQVQIFVGADWKTVGTFTVEGNPPTATYTPIPSPTVPTKTPRPTQTLKPTRTPRPTRTPTMTRTPRLTISPTP